MLTFSARAHPNQVTVEKTITHVMYYYTYIYEWQLHIWCYAIDYKCNAIDYKCNSFISLFYFLFIFFKFFIQSFGCINKIQTIRSKLSMGHFSWTRPDPAIRWPDPARDCRQKVWPDLTQPLICTMLHEFKSHVANKEHYTSNCQTTMVQVWWRLDGGRLLSLSLKVLWLKVDPLWSEHGKLCH